MSLLSESSKAGSITEVCLWDTGRGVDAETTEAARSVVPIKAFFKLGQTSLTEFPRTSDVLFSTSKIMSLCWCRSLQVQLHPECFQNNSGRFIRYATNAPVLLFLSSTRWRLKLNRLYGDARLPRRFIRYPQWKRRHSRISPAPTPPPRLFSLCWNGVSEVVIQLDDGESVWW